MSLRWKVEAQKLRAQIAQKLVQMVRLNRTRMNFLASAADCDGPVAIQVLFLAPQKR
jgi:hypothetical protein